ncbi:hypothetical protein HNR74_004525 [Flammeovirga kamogawensis]|nr:hypothetical protein [Flammeovirga kamogawensis]
MLKSNIARDYRLLLTAFYLLHNENSRRNLIDSTTIYFY